MKESIIHMYHLWWTQHYIALVIRERRKILLSIKGKQNL